MPDGARDNTYEAPTISRALREATSRLSPCSDSAYTDATVLLMDCLGLDQAALIAHGERTLDPVQTSRFQNAVERRVTGEPIAYITGERAFWSLSLEVDRNTLIPRPDTETLVEAALQHLPEQGTTRCLDLGTGSGAVALAIASERPECDMVAVDSDTAALRVARRNADRAGLDVSFVASDWFSALGKCEESSTFDVIVSNPPYIALNDPHLSIGDLRYEPTHALVSGQDGLTAMRLIVDQARAWLEGGWLMVEHGYDQREPVTGLFSLNGYTNIQTLSDLGGNPRVTLGQWTVTP